SPPYLPLFDHQFVSQAADRQQMFRRRRVLLDLLANAADMHQQGVLIAGIIIAPSGLTERLAGADAIAAPVQLGQQRDLFGRKRILLAAMLYDPALQIDDAVA